jgi:sugar (pentulose or hexulose) kinase
VKARLRAIAIDGTSGTILRCDRQGQPLGAPWMYHQVANPAALAEVQRVAPADHGVVNAGSTLTKVLQWRQSAGADHRFQSRGSDRLYLMHQADWLGFLLHGQRGITDYHNALKLGGDPVTLTYPDWLMALDIAPALPQIVAPGTPIAPVQPMIASELGLPPQCWVMAGTTDSIAAFLAAGVSQPGEAVTSLGSTLAIKLLSRRRVEDRRYGVYSHRLGDSWLVGGASNSGGAVLRQFFSDRDLATLSAQIDPTQPSPYDYYPLLQPGERFPIADPYYPPRLEPRPADPARFLQGLLEGMARIEALGYRRLAELGADPLVAVQTAGGGAQNPTWTAMRSRLLGVPVSRATQPEAAIGAARLAQGIELGMD